MNSTPQPTLDAQLRTLAIVVTALAMSVVTTAMVLLVVRAQEAGPLFVVDRLGMVSVLGIALALGALVGVLLVLRIVTRQSLARRLPADELQWGVAFVQRGIIGSALLEGMAMFNAAAYFLEGSPWALATALLLAGLLLALFFPSRARFDEWRAGIEHTARDLAQEQALRPRDR